MEIWCSWHKPFPIMIRHYGDGRKKTTRSHGICKRCLVQVMEDREVLKMSEHIGELFTGVQSHRDGLN